MSRTIALIPSLVWTGVVDEERLKNFVPADEGDAGHELIFRHLRDQLPEIQKRLDRWGFRDFIWKQNLT